MVRNLFYKYSANEGLIIVFKFGYSRRVVSKMLMKHASDCNRCSPSSRRLGCRETRIISVA